MVGDPGIEPGVRLREGVTVPCHTLRPVAHFADGAPSGEGLINAVSRGGQQENPQENPLQPRHVRRMNGRSIGTRAADGETAP